MNSVYVVVIQNRSGIDCFVGKDKEAAREKLYEYVQREWYNEIKFDEMPSDMNEAIEEYFHIMSEHGEEFLEEEGFYPL